MVLRANYWVGYGPHTGCKQSLQFNNATSLPTFVLFGVPQGSVLGPILCILYTADLLRIVEQFHLYSHL